MPDGIAGANDAVFLLWTSFADDDIDICSIKSPLVDLPAGATSIGLDAEAIDGRNANSLGSKELREHFPGSLTALMWRAHRQEVGVLFVDVTEEGKRLDVSLGNPLGT